MVDTKALLRILSGWAERFVAEERFERVLLFGSLLYQEGAQFVPGVSDIDLLCRFSSSLRTPAQIVSACRSALVAKQELEANLNSALNARRSKRPIVSILAITSFEEENGIHKGRDPRFIFDTEFLDLVNSSRVKVSVRPDAVQLSPVLFIGAVQSIQFVQAYRNKFFAVPADGKRVASTWNGKDPIPKQMMRSGAQLRYFAKRLSDKSDQDLRKGLEYIQSLVQNWAERDGSYRSLAEWLSVRRGGRGEREPLDSSNQLLLWEILANESFKQIRARQRETVRTAPVNVEQDSELRFMEAVLTCPPFLVQS